MSGGAVFQVLVHHRGLIDDRALVEQNWDLALRVNGQELGGLVFIRAQVDVDRLPDDVLLGKCDPHFFGSRVRSAQWYIFCVATDRVTLPPPELFTSPEKYYPT